MLDFVGTMTDFEAAATEAAKARKEEVEQLFRAIDFDASGTVNRQELERALQMMNLALSPQQIDYLWQRCTGVAAATQPQ